MKIETKSCSPNRVNEDFVLTETVDDLELAVVADGMGGLSLGHMASKIASESIYRYVKENKGLQDIEALLKKSLKYADEEVRSASISCRSRMGTAIAVAAIRGRVMHYTWIGNVRIYLNRKGTLLLLTEDHTVEVGYGRKCLTKCITGDGVLKGIDVRTLKIEKEDVIIMCTDGYYESNEIDFPYGEIALKNLADDASIIRIMDIC